MNIKTPEGLTIAEDTFALMVTSGVSKIDAVRAAFPQVKAWKVQSAYNKAYKVSSLPHVRKRIDDLIAERSKQLEADLGVARTDLVRVATGDARELCGVRLDCCRHCWGKDFRAQRTPEERRRAHREWLALPAAKRKGKRFDEEGGVGYDPRKLPNQDCPECHGRGVPSLYVTDTRMLSATGQALFAGARVVDRQIEVKLRDKDVATDRVVRMLGGYAKDNEQVMTPIGKALREVLGNVMQPNPDPRAALGDDDDDT